MYLVYIVYKFYIRDLPLSLTNRTLFGKVSFVFAEKNVTREIIRPKIMLQSDYPPRIQRSAKRCLDAA